MYWWQKNLTDEEKKQLEQKDRASVKQNLPDLQKSSEVLRKEGESNEV